MRNLSKTVVEEVMKVPAGFITEREMCEHTGKLVSTLRRWARIGYGPKRFVVGKEILYREDGFERWLNGVEREEPRVLPPVRHRKRPVEREDIRVSA